MSPDLEVVPQIAATILAGAAAATDAVRGKIYNKIVLFGLVLATGWLATLGVATLAGRDTVLVRYPELGHFGDPPAPDPSLLAQAGGAPSPAPAAREPRKPRLMPWEETPEQSVWPPPPSHDPVDIEVNESVTLEDVLAHPPPGADGAPDSRASTPVWTEPGSFWVYLAKVLLNTAIAFAVGFGLWWAGGWAAGDAKLFGMLAALLPLSTYRQAYWPIFPAYVLIFNTFLALLLLLVVELILRAARQAVRPTEDEAQAWRDAWKWCRTHVRELLAGFVGLLFLFLVIKTLRMLLRDALMWIAASAAGATSSLPSEVLAAPLRLLVYLLDSSVVVYFLLLLVFHPFSLWLRKHPKTTRAVVAATVLFVVYVAFFPFAEFTLEAILAMSGLMAALVFGLIVYQIYVNIFDFRAVRIWELRPRMIPSPRTLEVLKEDRDLLEHKMGPIGPDGLVAEQVETLRRWWIDRGKGGRIWVSRTIPFAPALLAGTLITAILGGYLVWI